MVAYAVLLVAATAAAKTGVPQLIEPFERLIYETVAILGNIGSNGS